MKKMRINRSWLLGLLVGLVMLVGASPALAGYFHIADVNGNDNQLANVQAVIDNYTATTNPNLLYGLCTTLVSSVKIEFTDDDGTVIIGSADFPYTANGITLSNGVFNDDDEVTSGVWSSTSTVNFFTIKAGNKYELWAWNGDPTGMTGTWSTGTSFLENKGTSHLSFFTTECSNVPIPGAIWLLGSGLGAFLIARRRKKQVAN